MRSFLLGLIKSFECSKSDREDDFEEIAWSIGTVSMVGGNLEISGSVGLLNLIIAT